MSDIANHEDFKKAIRAKTLGALKNTPEAERNLQERTLKDKLIAWIKGNGFQKIAIYHGVYPELDTPGIIAELEDVDVYLPRMQAKRQLSFHLYRGPEDLESTWNDIQQPKEDTPKIDKHDLDAIVVPGVAFLPSGYRIGFGGGYYDRFLADIKVPTVSVIFPAQEYPLGSWEAEEHDIPVGKIITVTDDFEQI